MPDWLSPFLSGSHPVFYPAVFTSILLAGLCFPISTDLVLLTCGYLVYQGQADAILLIALSIGAILTADSLMFLIGRKFGLQALKKWPFQRVFTTERTARAESAFQKYGYAVVFAARFMPGIRTVFMFTSGVLGLRWIPFILCDAAGAAIVVPSMIYAVGVFAGNRQLIGDFLSRAQWTLLGLTVVVFTFLIRRRNRKRLGIKPSSVKESSSRPRGPVDLRE